MSLLKQQEIIKDSKAVTLAALGSELGESNELTAAQKVMAAEIKPEDKKITCGKDGVISIPAAAYSKPTGEASDIHPMKSFTGGLQVFLPRFSRTGVTIMRGADRPGWRMPSSNYGRYKSWGFRVAVTPKGGEPPQQLALDLGDGVSLELVYIKPGTFVMGGEDSTDSKWHGRETPKHEVTLTKGYYLGKYEVTQAQFQKIMEANPSKGAMGPDCPVDNIGEGEAVEFCQKASAKTGHNVRLPTEAEWEYACRAGTSTKYFFGDDPAKLGEYAWWDKNSDGKSYPVGQKKPNPWGLYDMLGNVIERVSDIYHKDYYSNSPKQDPTGFTDGLRSQMEFVFNAPEAGRYALSAQVVTVNYEQRLYASANSADDKLVMTMPYTCGSWKECEPVTVELKKGQNTLKFWRADPPQKGIAIRSFTLQPLESIGQETSNLPVGAHLPGRCGNGMGTPVISKSPFVRSI